MYTLTLSAEEREAFDRDGDITFRVPEHLAWEIVGLAELGGGWPRFAPELVARMQAFVDRII